MIWAEYEPLAASEAMAATAVAYGENVSVRPNFIEADVILALDADFLDSSETGPSYAVDFYTRRKPDQEARGMNRLYVVENHYTTTGGLADHRLRVRACEMGAFLAAISGAVAELTGNSALGSVAAKFPSESVAFDKAWVTECAKDLVHSKGHALVLVGAQQPAAVQALGYALNEALGVNGTTLIGYTSEAKAPATIEALAAAIQNKSVETLIILGGNPVYNAPANLAFGELLASVPSTMHLSFYEDETSKKCNWVVPAAHYLETWGDVRSLDGTHTSIQPMILPLWDGLGQLDIIAQLAGRAKPVGPEIVRETFQKKVSITGSALDAAWNEYVRTGFLADSAYAKAPLSFNAAAVTSLIATYQPSPADGAELVFLKSSSVDDGRYANNSWLQETPDFVTKLTWDNAALVSPADAEKLGIKDGDMLEVSAGDTRLECAALVAPGHADDSVSIALGYGRKDVSALMQGVGFDAYPLRTATTPR
ncbi:MAG: molybdopterin dinucleotide binding domain-containing protein, partial [Chthoniobacterales bacterium]